MAEGYSPKILTGGESKSDDEILAAPFFTNALLLIDSSFSR